MFKSKYVVLILTQLLVTINFISCHTFTSQETEPKYLKYFKILSNIDDDSVFIQVQDEMHINPRVSSYILIVNVLDCDPSNHYVVFGEETDATAIRLNFYTLSKITREKLLRWNKQNTADLQNPIYYDDSRWTKNETNHQRKERLIRQVEGYSKEITDNIKALKLDPKNVDIISNLENSFYGRGIINEYLNEYSKALLDYSEAIKINPKSSFTYYLHGFLNYNLKEYSKAITDFKKAIEYDSSQVGLYSKIVDCFYHRAEDYYKSEEYSKAISDYKKVIELDSNQQLYRHDDINNRCGLSYIENKEYSKAISIYDKILVNNPQYSLAYLYRGVAYCENKNITKGCEDLQRANILGIPNSKKMLEKYCK